MLGSVNAGSFKPSLVAKAGETVTAYFEIYGTAPNVSVAFTLGRPGEDKALVEASGDLTATRDRDRRIATGELPLANLPAGDYIVRATAAVAGQPAGSVVGGLHVIVK